LAVFASRQSRTFDQGHVDLGRITRSVVEVIDSDIALQITEPG
jgi:hypothetical protein